MQGVSTFAILVLFVCAQTGMADKKLAQPCRFIEKGVKHMLGNDVVEEQDQVKLAEGADVRIYIQRTEHKNVVGSNILFCDDQVEKAEIELAHDNRSYLIHRKVDSAEPSFYVIQNIVAPGPGPSQDSGPVAPYKDHLLQPALQ